MLLADTRPAGVFGVISVYHMPGSRVRGNVLFALIPGPPAPGRDSAPATRRNQLTCPPQTRCWSPAG